jgi:hypothetical protein
VTLQRLLRATIKAREDRGHRPPRHNLPSVPSGSRPAGGAVLRGCFIDSMEHGLVLVYVDAACMSRQISAPSLRISLPIAECTNLISLPRKFEVRLVLGLVHRLAQKLRRVAELRRAGEQLKNGHAAVMKECHGRV